VIVRDPRNDAPHIKKVFVWFLVRSWAPRKDTSSPESRQLFGMAHREDSPKETDHRTIFERHDGTFPQQFSTVHRACMELVPVRNSVSVQLSLASAPCVNRISISLKLMMVSPHSSSSPKPLVPIRVLVADRNRMASQLLAESLGRDARFEISGIAATAELLSLAGSCKAEVAVISVDSERATGRGLQAARTLNARQPRIRLVLLLEEDVRDSVIAAFRCGATGVFCRTEPLSELPICIERVSRGEIWASRSHSEFLLEALRSAPSCEGIGAEKIRLLSHRELQVAECAAQGQSNKQIADHLELSEHTIKNYLVRIFEKLGVSNRFELLFLLFKECNSQTPGRVGAAFGSEIGHPIETYLKAAQEGFVAAQFIVGLAHLEGYCVEKNERSAYYWLKMAADNSSQLQQRSAGLADRLKANITQEDIDELERSVQKATRDNRLVATRPQDIIKRSASSPSLRLAV
jgi:two-component system, NarL family, nitrate/nitrite response regulator NarL